MVNFLKNESKNQAKFNNSCNLQCMKDGDNITSRVHELTGPVKIILVDPSEEHYTRKKWEAAFVLYATLMIGAITVIVLLFTLGFRLPVYNNIHVLLCTLGYQFFMPAAILMLHPSFGAAAPLKESDKRIEHILIHVLGLGCAISGTILVYFYGEPPSIPLISGENKTSYHYKTGIAAACLSALCVLTGPLIYFKKSEFTTPGILIGIHRLIGMLTFILGTVCFILGLIKPSFQMWLFVLGYMSPFLLMIFCTAFYTLVILYTTGNNFSKIKLSSIWKKKEPEE